VFFYGAPLEAMSRVVRSKSSDAIIYFPNGIGLLLGILQGVLVCMYPRRRIGEDDEDDESNLGLVDEDTLEEQSLVI
jgi:hypothetical protein